MKGILIVLYLENKSVDEHGLLSDLRVIVNSTNCHMDAFYKMGYSYFQSLMLAWGVSGDETRNHEQLKAHVDGNKKIKWRLYHCFPELRRIKWWQRIFSIIKCDLV